MQQLLDALRSRLWPLFQQIVGKTAISHRDKTSEAELDRGEEFLNAGLAALPDQTWVLWLSDWKNPYGNRLRCGQSGNSPAGQASSSATG